MSLSRKLGVLIIKKRVSQSDEYCFKHLGDALDKYGQYYDKFLLACDFNAEDSEPCLSEFLSIYNAKNIVKDKTCFKSLTNPSCIDLFITNSTSSFKKTIAVSTGLSDFHKMVVTVFKTTFKKNKPKEVFYRDSKKFDEVFKRELQEKLNQHVTNYETFEGIFLDTLEKYAPMKRKVIRGNEAPYMTKARKKAIMKRSELETKYFKNKTTDSLQNYKKHKHYCSRLYKKERRKYYEKFDLLTIRNFGKQSNHFLAIRILYLPR